MPNRWMKRLRLRRAGRGRIGWLSRIEGVEKPALLVGLGLLLYRVWRNGGEPKANGDERKRAFKDRWRAALARMRQKMAGEPSGVGLDGDRPPSPPAPPPA